MLCNSVCNHLSYYVTAHIVLRINSVCNHIFQMLQSYVIVLCINSVCNHIFQMLQHLSFYALIQSAITFFKCYSTYRTMYQFSLQSHFSNVTALIVLCINSVCNHIFQMLQHLSYYALIQSAITFFKCNTLYSLAGNADVKFNYQLDD